MVKQRYPQGWLMLLTLVLAGCGSSSGPEQSPAATLIRPDMSALHPNIAGDVRLEHTRALEKLADANLKGPDRAAVYGNLGHTYFTHGYYDASAAAYGRAHDAEPENSRWLYYFGFAQHKAGDADGAVTHWRKVLDLSSHDVQTNLRLGNVYLARNQFEEAKACFERARKVNPNEAAVFFGLGRVAAAGGDDKGAVGHFLSALSEQPGAGAVSEALGQAYLRLGEDQRADFYLKRQGTQEPSFNDPFLTKIAKIADAAILKNTIDMASDHEVFDHEGFLSYVRANLRKNEGFIELLSRVAQSKINGAAPDNQELARLFYAVGDLLLFREQFDDAIKNMAYAARLDPNYTELFLDLARANLVAGYHDNCLQLTASFLEARPDYAPARLLHASALVGKGGTHVGQAVDELDVMLTEDPNQIAVMVMKANILFARDQVDEAVGVYERALECDMSDREKAGYYNQFARLVQEHGRLAKAEQLFEKSLQFHPGSTECKYDLGGLLVKRKRYEKAALTYAEVTAAQPGFEPAHLSRAAALILAGQHSRALDALEESLAEIPNSLEIAHMLARQYAISPLKERRNPTTALLMAAEIYRVAQSALYAETYAMALAQNHKWDQAIELQSALVDSARKKGLKESVGTLQANLKRYRTKTTCCAQADATTLIGRPRW